MERAGQFSLGYWLSSESGAEASIRQQLYPQCQAANSSPAQQSGNKEAPGQTAENDRQRMPDAEVVDGINRA